MTTPCQPTVAMPPPLAPWGTMAAGALIDYLPMTTTFVVEGAERRPFSVDLWTETPGGA